MASRRKNAGKVGALWRPTRAIRNFLALHSLRYKTNKVGGVGVYRHFPMKTRSSRVLPSKTVVVPAHDMLIVTFGRDVSDESVLALLRARTT